MPPRPDPNLDKADLHHRRARQFRDLAQVILEASPITGEYTDILVDTAGALMYEAAKQWVNAVANCEAAIRRPIRKSWPSFATLKLVTLTTVPN